MENIFNAASAGDLEIIENYLKNGGDPYATIDDAWAQTIAYRGYESGHNKIVECIVNHLKITGQSLNRIAIFDVLCAACIQGDLEMVQYLHEQGVNLRTSMDFPLHYAIDNNQTLVIAYIRKVCPTLAVSLV